MDDEVITWNLKGPKRMKKRRELNALIRNNLKYKSLIKTSSMMDSSNKFHLSRYTNGGSGGRNSAACNSYLLRSQNDEETSSEDLEDFYFSANKSVIRE